MRNILLLCIIVLASIAGAVVANAQCDEGAPDYYHWHQCYGWQADLCNDNVVNTCRMDGCAPIGEWQVTCACSFCIASGWCNLPQMTCCTDGY